MLMDLQCEGELAARGEIGENFDLCQSLCLVEQLCHTCHLPSQMCLCACVRGGGGRMCMHKQLVFR